eukprot:9519125-Ditylum_brightwellii.AAC.1
MRWNPVLKSFCDPYQVVYKIKKQDDPDVPIIKKSLPIMKWMESFKDHLQRLSEQRMIPLSYVIRDVVTVPATAPPFEKDNHT